MRLCRLWICVAAIAALAACVGTDHDPSEMNESTASRRGETPPDSLPDIRGVITHANLQSDLRSVRIEADPGEEAGSPKASVRIEERTRILIRTPQGFDAARADTLHVGMLVSAWFSGPATLSYPMQATASTIVIEEEEEEEVE